MLIPLVRDGDADPTPSQSVTELAAAVSLIAHQAFGTPLGATPANPLDRALVQQLLGDGGFMLLARRKDKGHQLPIALHTHMQLGAEPALAAT